MRPEEYLEIKKRVLRNHRRLERVLADALASARQHPFPKNLRPATGSDIVVGQVIWCYYDEPHWLIIDEVLDPSSQFKAFISDGCRYGLDDSYIEIDPGTRE